MDRIEIWPIHTRWEEKVQWLSLTNVLLSRISLLNQPVLVDLTDVNTTPMYKTGYTVGYKDGRGKQRKYKSLVTSKNGISTDYKVGYEAGFAEGKARKPKRFVI